MFPNSWKHMILAIALCAISAVAIGFAEDSPQKNNRVSLSMEEARLTKDPLKSDPILISKTIAAAPGDVIEISLEVGAGVPYRWLCLEPSSENFVSVIRERDQAKQTQIGTGGTENAIWRATVGKGGSLVFVWGQVQGDPKTKKLMIAEPRRALIVTTVSR